LKIAFIDEDLSPRTGSRRFTCEVTRELQNMGHEVKILTGKMNTRTCFREYLSIPMELVSKVPPHDWVNLKQLGTQLRKYISILPVQDDLRYYLRQASLMMELSRRVEELKCDAAMLQYHGEHWLLPIFYYLREPAGSVYLNVVPPMPRPRALPFQELTLSRRIVDQILNFSQVGRWKVKSYRNLALIMAPSNYLLEQARKQGLVTQKKTEVVPLGVNHSKFFPTGEEEPFALCLGRIHPHKSLELAIMAMRNTNSRISLMIAGDIEERFLFYKTRLKSLAEKMKISDRVKIVLSPSDAQVVRLMQRCSVFLFPSTIDTFGLVALEAMACGKPVVACNRGGVPETVGNGGFLLEPDVEKWQKAVSRLFSDSNLRKQMSSQALERSKSFSWENTAKRLIHGFSTLNLKVCPK
jgi:glycosyltransferase involved in cell wall biosynthesis